MKDKIFWYELIGLIFTVVFSVVFHFMYKWTGALGWLFPVNESVWEHLKILFMPYLIYTFIELFLLKPVDKINFFAIKSIALLVIPVTMIVLFFTYSGIIGKNFLLADIFIGVLALFAGFVISYRLIMIEYKVKKKYLWISLAAVFFVLMIVFTYFPPHINLFFDPVTGTYGINI